MNDSVSFNEQYELLVKEAIGDAFYSNQSYEGRVSRLRKYSEIIVRKLIGLGKETKLTLGDKKVTNGIAALPDHQFIERAVFTVRDLGDKATHSEYTEGITEQDYKKITDAVFDLLAGLLINYFAKHKFGMENGVQYCLSLLPPIIRWKALTYLFENPDNSSNNIKGVNNITVQTGKQNITLIDKLFLAILKAKGRDEALSWLQAHKTDFEALKVIDRDFYEKAKRERGEAYVLTFYGRYEDAPTMYRSCLGKISNTGGMYLTFEEAKPYYEQHKKQQEEFKKELIKQEELLWKLLQQGQGQNQEQEHGQSQDGQEQQQYQQFGEIIGDRDREWKEVQKTQREDALQQFLLIENLRIGITSDEFNDLMDFLFLGWKGEGEVKPPVVSVRFEVPGIEGAMDIILHGNSHNDDETANSIGKGEI